MFRSFQSRIILFFSLLFILIQCGVLYAVYHAFETRLIQEASDELAYASGVFHKRLIFQDDILKTQALIVSSDAAVIAALNANDILELDQRLKALKKVYSAERIVILKGNRIIADTSDKYKNNPYLSVKNLQPVTLNLSETNKPSIGRIDFVKLDNRLYEFFLTPIKKESSTDTYWVAVGATTVRDALSEMRKQFALNLDILLFHQDGNIKEKFQIISNIGSLSTVSNSEIIEFLNENHGFSTWSLVRTIQVKKQKYLAIPVHVTKKMGQYNNSTFLLLYPYSEIFKTLNQLMMKLILLFSYGLLFIIAGAWLIGVKMSEPIKELVRVAKEIAKGNYKVKLPKRRQDEFKTLSETFATMTKTIQAREVEIRHQALHDSQTKLPNRQYFETLLDAKLKHIKESYSKSLGMLFIGIGRYEEINNIVGHRISDELIVKVIKRLNDHSEIKLLARFSDDKLIALTEGISQESLGKLAYKVHQEIEKPYSINGFKIDITPYISICLIDSCNDPAKLWIRRGDYALYQAKTNEVPVFLYDSTMGDLSSDRLSMMGELVNGLKNGEFLLYFQPKVSLSCEHIHYVEALVRWEKPNKGLVSPDEFIPLAEKTGHIQKLTHWAIEQAAQYASTWYKKKVEVKIAVNISSRDLTDDKLVEFLHWTLDHYNLPARFLSLEVTESDLIRNLLKAKEILTTINQMGISIAIDDFGIGYSSIAYLKELPINEIKIDKSFITQLNEEPESVMIVGSIIELAHKMNLSVVAEGVESGSVIEKLKEYHCDYVQGYYYSAPVNAENLIKWIKKNG